jgi:hypothetical protein
MFDYLPLAALQLTKSQTEDYHCGVLIVLRQQLPDIAGS